MSYFDIGYFKKKPANRSKKLLKRKINNKIIAFDNPKEFYDGHRDFGYGGFKYDGRWIPLIEKIIHRYNLKKNCKVLDLGCKKGFFLKSFKEVYPTAEVYGIEDHSYPLTFIDKNLRKNVILSSYESIPFKNNFFDFIIGFSSIYRYNLGGVLNILREIERTSKNSYVTLASFSNKKEKELFEKWTLTGTTILSKSDWKKVFKYCEYTGDYFFTTIKSLGLK